jgi:hypothetical protein
VSVPSLDIADAVVTALNATDLSQSVTFERVYVPKFDTANAATLQGKVVPVSDIREMGSAADDNATIAVDIGVMQRLHNDISMEQAAVDALLGLCEEIKAVINRQRLSGAETAVCIGTAQDVIYSVEELDNGRVFLTAIRAIFLVTVAI